MIIVVNNRDYNFKGIIDNYDFGHNHAALLADKYRPVAFSLITDHLI